MRWSVLVVAMLAFAGCVDEEPETTGETTDPVNETSSQTQTSTSGGSSSAPAPTPNEDCNPTVGKAGSRYVARCTVEYRMTFVSGDDAGYETGNGDVRLSGGPSRTTIDMWGRGDTEDEARARLAALSVAATKTHIDVNSDEDGWNNQGADIRATSTVDLGDVTITTGNGDIEVDMRTTGQALTTGNGDVTTEGHIGTLGIDTGNGDVTVDGEVGDMMISSGNGEIEADVTPLASADWQIQTGNQEIMLRIKEDSSKGYDISATTGNGDITFETQETTPSGQSGYGSAREKTTGYEARSIQVDANLTTGNGDIDIRSDSSQSTN